MNNQEGRTKSGRHDEGMDYHALSAAAGISYRRSGLFLSGLLGLVFIILLVRGANHPLLLAAALLMAAGARFEVWFVRRTVDALIGAGTVMQRFTNPLLFGLIYVLAVLPTAAVLRVSGKDVLDLRRDRDRKTYWKPRSDGKDWKGSFRNQF